MSYVKSSSFRLSRLKERIERLQSSINSAFEDLYNSSDYRHKINPSDSRILDATTKKDWTRCVEVYNDAIDNIHNSASTTKSKVYGEFATVIQVIDNIMKRITEFENDTVFAAQLDALDKVVNEMSDAVYSQLYAYSSDGKSAADYAGEEASDMAFGKDSGGTGNEVEDPTGGGGGAGGSSGGGAGGDDYEDTSPAEFNTPYEGDGSAAGDYGDYYNPDLVDPLSSSGSPGSSYDSSYTPSDYDWDSSSGGSSGGYDWDDPYGYSDGLLGTGTGSGTNPYDVDYSPTAADIIGTSSSAFGSGLGGGLTGTGADGESDPDYKAAGAAAVMLGLTSLGDDEAGVDAFLSNLAQGLDSDRTLMNVGLEDVFEHPDYTGDGKARLSNGNGEDGLDEYGRGVDAFDLKAVQDAGAGAGVNNLGVDLARGAGALLGAAAVGGFAANAFMNMDEAEGGMFGGDVLGKYGSGADSKKTLSELLFGKTEEEDEEKRKEQNQRERIAIIATASSLLASAVTFFLSAFGVIGPIWFLIPLLLLITALLNVMFIIDKKGKDREEKEAMKKITGKASEQKRFIKQEVQESPKAPEADWVLFGLVLLSTSSFILKSYDVISWLIFLLLLLLFVLVIFVYLELKKRLGEDETPQPINKFMGPLKK